MWNLPEVRRHRVVPSLELPYDGRVAAVQVLLAEGKGGLGRLRLLDFDRRFGPPACRPRRP